MRFKQGLMLGLCIWVGASPTPTWGQTSLTPVPVSKFTQSFGVSDSAFFPGVVVIGGSSTTYRYSAVTLAEFVASYLDSAGLYQFDSVIKYVTPHQLAVAIPDSLPPNGVAGGDLTGDYPNPTVANGAITNAKVSNSAAIAYSKLNLGGEIQLSDLNATGTKNNTTFLRGDNTWAVPAVSGSAGGDLTGTYPNPTLALGNAHMWLAVQTFNYGIAIKNGENITLGTSGGTMIGDLSTEKLGFWGTTPVAQPTGDILTALAASGIVATPSIAAADITGGLLTNVVVAWPGALYNTPTVGVNTGTVDTLKPTLATEPKNVVFAGPPSGSNAAPAFRALVSADIPPDTVNGTAVPAGSNVTVTAQPSAAYSPQVFTVSSNPSSYTINSSYANIQANVVVNITAQAQGLTLAAPTGSWVINQRLSITVVDGGSSEAISWNADFVAGTTTNGVSVPLPTATQAGKINVYNFVYYSSTKILFTGGTYY